MLIQNGLADACPLGDVVHRGGVVALRHENVPGSPQQLQAAC
jgi:hypothetical protein